MAKSTFENVPIKEGQIVDLKIDSMAYDNSAVSRYKDFIIFVDRGAPEDLVTVEITTVKHNYARGKILEIKTPGLREDPKCKLFKVCGGCQWQHLSYENQLVQKNLLMRNFVSKLNLGDGVLRDVIGGENYVQRHCEEGQSPDEAISPSINEMEIASPSARDDVSGIWHYRNKVQYPVRTVEETGRLKAGYFEWNSNDLINVKHCPIQNEKFDDIIETVRELAPKYKITAWDGKKKKRMA